MHASAFTAAASMPGARAGAARPQDQAEGLRQLFAHASARFVPVVSNPHVPFSSVMLERLCTACTDLGEHVLVVDAAETSPAPRELTLLDIAEGVERLTPQVSYLAARGLPLQHVDSRGSTAGFLQAVSDAAPHAGVVLVHAGASELVRLFARRTVRPLLLADDRPDSVTHAYASLKLLAQRAGLMAHDLMLAAAPHSPRAGLIAKHMSRCADDFVGAVLRECVLVDPATPTADASSPELRHLVHSLLLACEPGTAAASFNAVGAPTSAADRSTWAWPQPAAAWAT
jgi:flagellar biosynthesis protein FlhG